MCAERGGCTVRFADTHMVLLELLLIIMDHIVNGLSFNVMSEYVGFLITMQHTVNAAAQFSAMQTWSMHLGKKEKRIIMLVSLEGLRHEPLMTLLLSHIRGARDAVCKGPAGVALHLSKRFKGVSCVARHSGGIFRQF